MSGSTSRRTMIQSAGALALLPLLAPHALAASRAPLAPPLKPMRFTRKLTRELAGGYSVVVERAYEIAFSRSSRGFRIVGSQVAVNVEAPSNLEAFAKLERERVERGLFPMQLDAGGLILSCPESVPSENLAKAVDEALSRISAMSGEDGDRRDARSFVLQLQQAAGQISNEPPANLFVPPPAAESVTRRVVLPGGTEGVVTTTFAGAVSGVSGLMESAERTVVTETGGTLRRTLEHWSLGPISWAILFAVLFYLSAKPPNPLT